MLVLLPCLASVGCESVQGAGLYCAQTGWGVGGGVAGECVWVGGGGASRVLPTVTIIFFAHAVYLCMHGKAPSNQIVPNVKIPPIRSFPM